MRKIFLLSCILSFAICADLNYEIKVNKDEIFINSNKFRAISTCSDFISGDKVVFLKGSSKGKCLKAEILNVDKNISCEIWCDS